MRVRYSRKACRGSVVIPVCLWLVWMLRWRSVPIPSAQRRERAAGVSHSVQRHGVRPPGEVETTGAAVERLLRLIDTDALKQPAVVISQRSNAVALTAANVSALKWPQSCGIGTVPHILVSPAQGVRNAMDGTPWPGTRAVRVTPAELLHRIRKHSKSTGIELFVSNSGSVPQTAAAPPLVDSHNGTHDIFQVWPLSCSTSRGGRSRGPGKWCASNFKFSRSAASAVAPQLIPAAAPPWVAAVPDAWTHSGNVMTCGWSYHGGGCRWEFSPFAPQQHRPVVVAIGDSWSRTNYFHFLHEQLPRLALVLPLLLADRSASVVVPGGVPFIWEYLVDVVGLSPEQIIHTHWNAGRGQGDVKADWVLLPQPQLCGNGFLPSVMLLRRTVLRRLALEEVAVRPAGGDDVLTVLLAERRGSRMPQNWGEVRGMLADCCGVGRCDWGLGGALPLAVRLSWNASVAAQVRMFNAADVVVGPHGANLANVLWMRHGADVVELASHSSGNMAYYAAASRLGLRYRMVLHSGDPYNVSLAELARHLVDAAGIARGARPLLWT
eukprot:TRINITY_DN18244_c0_g5_i1.p1 TRINITY_DN18244_c0_g5~~TRINITY_DN18244_c0_g5_i1.p1  ORF type:complete len:551 (+),score=84.87 TRINITY_DN18244_c0_g5_i1:97-1749(+)